MKETKQYREIVDWEYFRNVPIYEVAESLGIEVDKNGRALCPCHDDHNPSMIIGSKTNQRRENSWWCPVCNEGGSTLDLVLASKYNVLPSQMRKNRQKYSAEILEAVHWLEELFPGGITKVSTVPDSRNRNEPLPPKIPWAIIREIGLKHNPIFEKGPLGDELSKTDRAEILLDKLMNREKELWQYAVNVTVNFPALDAKANAVIFRQAREWIAEIHSYTEEVRKYYFAMSDYEYPDESFADELSGEKEPSEMEYA